MNMKKHEDLTKSEIDRILIEEYDLGFLLEQIRDRKKHGLYWLSISDVLRFIPQFNESVNQLRKELRINPVIIRNDLCQLLGRDNFWRFITISKEIGRGISFPLSNKKWWSSISKQIIDWKKRNYPTLSFKVAILRLRVLDNTPHAWQEAIEDFILFEKISSTALIYRRSAPKLDVKHDKETYEPYIEIKVYADTDIRILQKISWWKEMQKELRGYCDPREWDQHEWLVLTRFLQYILRKHLKVSQRQTLEWLKARNLNTPDYQHSSQEVRRFEELFMSTGK